MIYIWFWHLQDLLSRFLYRLLWQFEFKGFRASMCNPVSKLPSLAKASFGFFSSMSNAKSVFKKQRVNIQIRLKGVLKIQILKLQFIFFDY